MKLKPLMNLIEALAAIFTAHQPQTFDRTGSTDGYLNSWGGVAPVEADFTILKQGRN